MCGSGRNVVNVAFRLFRMKYAQSSMNPWCVFFSVALYLWRCYMWIFTFTKVMLWNVHPFFQLWFYEELDLPTLTFDGVISGSYFSYFLYFSYFFMRFLLEGQEDHYIIHLVWFMYLLLPWYIYIYIYMSTNWKFNCIKNLPWYTYVGWDIDSNLLDNLQNWACQDVCVLCGNYTNCHHPPK